MEGFWLSLGLIFIAEMGDKTQLVALTLATRFNAMVVLAGVCAATLAVHAFSVGLGLLAGRMLPQAWTVLLCGLAFIGFGLWTLRGDKLDEDETRWHPLASPFLAVCITFFLAELGDKTMLGTVTLASQYSPTAVWLGSTAGMVLADGIAIWVGQILGERLPEKAIKYGAAAIFFGVGVFYAIDGLRQLYF